MFHKELLDGCELDMFGGGLNSNIDGILMATRSADSSPTRRTRNLCALFRVGKERWAGHAPSLNPAAEVVPWRASWWRRTWQKVGCGDWLHSMAKYKHGLEDAMVETFGPQWPTAFQDRDT